MDILVFDGQFDAYFWVLCTEKYFKVKGTTEMEKMVLAEMEMRGRALHWWLWWVPRHPR
ncbi:swarming motility protein ybiA, partial [Trifolium medium]|nr:swarming motility protein ybiA [Trifolium medium]